MEAKQAFRQSAADLLYFRVTTEALGAGFPAVAESVKQAAPREKPGPDALASVRLLAQGLVGAVTAISRGELDPDRFSSILEAAMARHLAGRDGMARGMKARIAAEAPWLLNLPRLCEIAETGLRVFPEIPAGLDEGGLIMGRSKAFARIIADLDQVAATDFPVLLTGETGTGKELLARRLHNKSGRSGGPFVVLNCAAVSPNLVESELFGHLAGAFTGAEKARPGLIKAADGGTLFLDEIAEAPYEVQVKLLRVLESRKVTPVGGQKEEPVDFRLVTASHLDLAEESEQGRFNQALLYRIMVIPLYLPPLRKRKEDIKALAEHFLAQSSRMAKRVTSISPRAMAMLKCHDWPGNVRELSHMIQRLTALSRDGRIRAEDLPPEIKGGADSGLKEKLIERLAGVSGINRDRALIVAGLLSANPGGLVNRDLRRALNVGESTSRNILNLLCKEGLLRAVGEKSGRRYLITAD